MPRARKAPPIPDPHALRLAVLPLINTVIYPQIGISLYVTREPSARAVEEANSRNLPILVVAQRNPEQEEIGPDDLYTVGTEATVGRILKLPDGHTNVLVQGQRRVRILGYDQILPFLIARVEPIEENIDKPITTEALMRAVLALFEKCVKSSKNLPEDHYIAAMNVEEPGRLADLVASSLDLSMPQRQDLLETIDPAERLQKVIIHLSRELELLDLQNRIHSQVQQEVDKSQREFFLREQLKAIQKELGETDSFTKDLGDLRERLDSLTLPDVVREKADVELRRLSAMPTASPEVGIIRTYLDWLLT
ncbi:MAG: LON peptidase substrate-binding domain-containing protein, partial [Chloroflexota bacterium]